MRNQTKLTNFLVPVSSPHLSRPSSIARSTSTSSLPAISGPMSRVPSVAPSCVLLIAPSLAASLPPSSHGPSPVELSENGDESDGNDDIAGSDCELDDGEHNSTIGSDDEEDNIDNAMEASGSQPRARKEICGWEELREQIKSDLEEAHRRHEALTHMNKLLILRNFTMLHIKDTE